MPERPVAIITGAGSGIGRAVAVELARRGWRLALAGRRAAPLSETGALLDGSEPDAWIAVTGDVGEASGCERLAQTADERFGRIDAVINNAGYAPLVPMGEIDGETIEQIFRVNTLGPLHLVRASWNALSRAQTPRVVSVSSMASRDPFPGLGVYGGAKASLNLLASAWTTEGESIGLKAFSVAPGAVETAMLRGVVSKEDYPTENCMTPEHVAGVIVACVTGERDSDAGKTIFLPGPGQGEVVDAPGS